MITFYAPGTERAGLETTGHCSQLAGPAIWIDVYEPTRDEERTLEEVLGVQIPTREEMQEIELSSRLYKANDVLFMTGTVLTGANTNIPESSAITFILTSDKLITLRYADPAPFNAFRARREANLHAYRTSYEILGGLLDAIIERLADILENVGAKLDGISVKVFGSAPGSPLPRLHSTLTRSASGRARRDRQRDFVEILREIGRVSDLVSRARESLVSFGRVIAFYREMQKDNPAARESLIHLRTLTGDLGSLSDHASFLSTKVSFMLDATLGMINNEQNAIIKIISVAALVFLPPTLVAGLYGMNFDVMPELRWAYGYPFAICLMVISAVLPYLFFRRKGWL